MCGEDVGAVGPGHGHALPAGETVLDRGVIRPGFHGYRKTFGRFEEGGRGGVFPFSAKDRDGGGPDRIRTAHNVHRIRGCGVPRALKENVAGVTVEGGACSRDGCVLPNIA